MKKNLLVVLLAAFAASSSFAGALDGGTVLSPDGVAVGPGSFVDSNGGVAIGAGADAAGQGSVALGAGSIAIEDNTVEVGGRRVTGLGAGTNASDAATVGQVSSMVTGSLAGFTDELSRGIAAVAATPSLPALAAGERAVAAGMASYNGFQAVGVTFAQAVSNQAQFYVGANFSGDSGGTVFRGGGAWKF